MAVHLVRHAHAGSRSAWTGDDGLRPLSAKGRGQAEGMAERLKGEPITCIVSSPSRRCVETAEPLARMLGIEIEERHELLEGGDPDAVIGLLGRLAPEDAVVVSHGDVIPKVIRRLTADGMHTKDANVSQKGSWWTLLANDGRFVRGRYHAPV